MPTFNPNDYGLFTQAQIAEIRRQWARIDNVDKQVLGQIKLMIDSKMARGDALQQLINAKIHRLSDILQRYKETGQLRA